MARKRQTAIRRKPLPKQRRTAPLCTPPAKGVRRGVRLRPALLGGGYALGALVAPGVALAQFAVQHGHGGAPASRSAPVTFRADNVDYDSHNGLVTWTGHVQIWQNDHILRADRVTYDRNTDVAAASGHVALVEPDGQVVFSDYAELTQGMRQGVMDNMRALMTQNGKLAANGARRTDGQINELSRVVYTACKVCAQHPETRPFWQIRAYSAVQDIPHKRIEYQDAYLDMFGVPVMYFPFFSAPDPSVHRQSGFLMGTLSPHDEHLGTFATLPYYWVINDSSDLTIVPLLATRKDPQLTLDYRKSFNDGVLHAIGAVAGDEGAVQAYLQAHALFALNSVWRAGADISLSTSANYMRDYRVPGYGADVLGSTAYLEGFGVGSYARLDGTVFQGLNKVTVNDSTLPLVLPRFTYSYFSQPDALGGRFSLDSTSFNIYRPNGVSDERFAVGLNWDRPFHDSLGQQFVFTAHVDTGVWNARKLDLIPVYGTTNAATTARALPTVALKMNWPFVRSLHSGGSQTIEPIVQLVAAPQSGNSVNDNIPNEDSLDYEFTDATLFNINRHQGVDRLDGGARANVGLHGNWTFKGDQQLDALIGQSYQAHVDRNQVPDSGLEHPISDFVGRLSYTPASWLDMTARGRFDPKNGNTHFADGLVSVGVPLLRVSGGYTYNSHDIYYYYDNNYRLSTINPNYYVPRNEITLGTSSVWREYSLNTFARRDIERGRMVALGANAGYTNDCFSFHISYVKRYTTINGDTGDQSILFTFTFKTLGIFAVNG